MNFKRNLFVITTALVGALAISGCTFDKPTSFKRFYFIEEPVDDHKDVEGKGYIKYGKYASYKVSDTHGGEVELGTPYEVMRDYSGVNLMPSEGKQKLLVIPVEFQDYKVSKLSLSEKDYVENINKVFFGVQENNSYVSVSEYFNRSSYGKLRLDGKVCDKIYTFPLSVQKIKDKKISRDTLATEYYSKIIEWYKENYDDIDNYRIKGLPEGKDVPIYLVYTYPSEDTDVSKTFFWAYTFRDTPLSWSSYSFSYVKNTEPVSHTYIHETGHLLGLVDYYPTIDSTELLPEPTGRIDMMDCSIGDETGLSKMLLNWTRPYFVKDSCILTINSFTNTGDLILLANSWNGTVFDEYYLVEFYTPTGLNTYDVSYGNTSAKLPTVPGIKIYHVDARLGYTKQGLTKTVIGYCENGGEAPTKNNIDFAHDNNTYQNPNNFQKNYLYTLILNNAKGITNGCAANINLYRPGDNIGELNLNRDGKLNFKINVEDINFSRAVVKIEKTA